MKVYSVFDYLDRKWDHYEGPGGFPASGVFRHGGAAATKSPEGMLAKLPHDAVHIGSSDKPRGIIARIDRSRGVEMASLGDASTDGAPSSALSWVGLAVVVAGAFYVGRKSVAAEKQVRSKVAAARRSLA